MEMSWFRGIKLEWYLQKLVIYSIEYLLCSILTAMEEVQYKRGWCTAYCSHVMHTLDEIIEKDGLLLLLNWTVTWTNWIKIYNTNNCSILEIQAGIHKQHVGPSHTSTCLCFPDATVPAFISRSLRTFTILFVHGKNDRCSRHVRQYIRIRRTIKITLIIVYRLPRVRLTICLVRAV